MSSLKHRGLRTAFAMLLSTTLVLTTACSSGGSKSEGKDGEITEITMNTLSYSTEFPDSNFVLVKEFEKRTNTKLNIDWVPVTTATDKFNVLYASGNLPDVTFTEDMNNQQIRNLIKQGVFWDLTDMIKDYPNLSADMLDDMWEKSKIDGKNYMIPRYYPTHGGGIFPMLRKDWLDKLNLSVPTTMDELYDTLVAFKEKDPDGNGKNDSVPYSASVTSMAFVYNIFNDNIGNWKLRDGELHPIITEKESTDALLWIKKAYDAGLFPSDFVILKFSQVTDLLKSGKAGGGGYSMNNSISQTFDIKKIVPEADLIPLASLTGPSGNKFTPSGAPFYGFFLIPKKVSEEKVKKILSFFDYGYSPEGNELANYGIKDVHFKEENGRRVRTEKFESDKIGTFEGIFMKLNDEQVLGDPSKTTEEIYNRNQEILNERKKIVLVDPTLGLTSEAQTKYWADIQKKVDDMRTKVILGQETIDSYNAFIEKLKQDANLQEVVKEMNEAYAAKQAQSK